MGINIKVILPMRIFNLFNYPNPLKSKKQLDPQSSCFFLNVKILIAQKPTALYLNPY